MTDSWPILDVSEWELAGEETQGLRAHPWLRHQTRPRLWLYKPTEDIADRPLTEGAAEKLASEIARVLAVPAARVELAQRHSTHGCVVEDVRWSKGSHEAGQVLMGALVDDYDPTDRGRRGHSIANVCTALEQFGAPPNSPTPAGFTAFDVFTGYLVFDALIANTDRHDRNWAVLVRPPGEDGPDALCASYDHASSLGFNVTDGQRTTLLADGTVKAWAHKGSARQFEHRPGSQRRTLVDVAREAALLCSADVRGHWLDSVMSVPVDRIDGLLDATPGLTPVTKRFTREVLMINQERLRDALR